MGLAFVGVAAPADQLSRAARQLLQMVQFLADLGKDLLASLIWTGVIVAVGWLLIRKKRTRLIQFFGVERERRVVIYWSLVRVLQGGSVGVDNRPRGYYGPTIPSGELDLIAVYQRLFNYVVPSLQEQPGFLRNLLLSDVKVEISPSPLRKEDIDRGSSLVSFGSPGYNVVSQWIEDELRAVGRFVPDMAAVEVDGIQPFHGMLSGFIQRVRIQDGPTMAFYVAGVSERATKAAAYYLASRWEDLQRRFGNRENFCVVIRAANDDFRNCTVLLERRW
jgi:hypothetical protein